MTRFVCFNINGIRARQHQLEAIKEIIDPDVIGLQETKVHDEQFPLADVEGGLSRRVFWSKSALRRRIII